MTQSANTLPADTAVGRVALRVADLDRLADFYESVVGLDVQRRSEGRTVLGAGGTPLLELQHAPDASPRGRGEAGLFHTAFRVPTREALGDALVRIEDEWRLTGASDHHVSEALYLGDPEDNGVEIYRDRPRTTWPREDGRVRMETLPLDLDSVRDAAGDAPAESVPAGTDVGHVHLEVTALDSAREFYVDTLGLNLRQEIRGALFVAAGDYHHHVGLNTWHGRRVPAEGRGLDWFELRLPDDGTLDAVRDRLADADVETTDVANGLAVADADGIELRLVVP